MIKIIKTFLMCAKENLNNTYTLIFVGMNIITIAYGVTFLTLLEMIPKEIGKTLMAFGAWSVAIVMFSLYLWAKRHPNKNAKQKIDKNELIAFICGILSGVFITSILWLVFK